MVLMLTPEVGVAVDESWWGMAGVDVQVEVRSGV